MRNSKLAIASSLLVGQAFAALEPIHMKGSKFFYPNGTQFFMRGVAYQQDSAAGGATTGSTKYADPLANPAACRRDIPLLAELNTNTIRTYAIDPDADHTVCMKLLDDAGIYVVSDLSEPALSVNRDTPLWDTDLLKRYIGVVDALAKYDNVIGFFAGNEVSNNNTNTPASAFVKAAVRDTKAHIKKNYQRWLGVGYAANDDPEIRVEIAHYFNCGEQDSAIDFWGYNIYSWCGKSSMQISGYDKQVEFFKNYSVPVFFAEYGCNIGGAANRIWQESTALYEDEMTGVFSGGIVYMYHQEANDYGLVEIKGSAAVTQKDFAPLATVMAKVDPKGVDESSYNPTNQPQACPEISKNWKVTGDALPPTPDEKLCECMYKSLSCVPSRNLSPKDYGSIFGFICGEKGNNCAGISANTETGVYGAYSMCNPQQKLGHVLDTYYRSQKSAAGACDFDKQAVLQVKGAQDASCKDGLASASVQNGIAATATSGSSGAAGTAAKSSSFAVPVPMKNLFTMGDVAIGLYAAVAMGVGAGMILL
ncbi:Glucanosyltransferase-domain-containing protein [Podospora conica]|nr:Glucanosyltransferase-domain-containing protein [Schizothecium conicum]